jgi:hypothetical protein
MLIFSPESHQSIFIWLHELAGQLARPDEAAGSAAEHELAPALRFASFLYRFQVFDNPEYRWNRLYGESWQAARHLPDFIAAADYLRSASPEDLKPGRRALRLRNALTRFSRVLVDEQPENEQQRAAGHFRVAVWHFVHSPEGLLFYHRLYWRCRGLLVNNEPALRGQSEIDTEMHAQGFQGGERDFRLIRRGHRPCLVHLISDEEGNLVAAKIGKADRRTLHDLPESEWTAFDCDFDKPGDSFHNARSTFLSLPCDNGKTLADQLAEIRREAGGRPLAKPALRQKLGRLTPKILAKEILTTVFLYGPLMGLVAFACYFVLFAPLSLLVSLIFGDRSILGYMFGGPMILLILEISIGVCIVVITGYRLYSFFFESRTVGARELLDMSLAARLAEQPAAMPGEAATETAMPADVQDDGIPREAQWTDIEDGAAAQRWFAEQKEPLSVEIETADDSGATRVWTSLAHWGDIALVFPGVLDLKYRLPLVARLQPIEWPGGQQPARLDLRLGNDAPLVLSLPALGLRAQIRAFAYSHDYRQDTAYLAADAEELIEKAALAGRAALTGLELSLLPVASLYLILQRGLLDDPADVRRQYNRMLQYRQKHLARRRSGETSADEPADAVLLAEESDFAATPAELVEQLLSAWEISPLVREWLYGLGRDQVTNLVDTSKSWLLAHGGDPSLLSVLRSAAELCELPGERWQALRAAALADPGDEADIADRLIAYAGEKKKARQARLQAALAMAHLRRQPPGPANILHRLAGAFGDISRSLPSRVTPNWQVDLHQKLDQALSERGYTGAYPEYERPCGCFAKTLTLHEENVDTPMGWLLSLSACLAYWDAKRGRWVATRSGLPLLTQTVHPIATLNLDETDLYPLLDTYTKILDGHELDDQDKERLGRSRESNRGLASGVLAASTLTGILLFIAGLVLNAVTDVFINLAGDAAHPWSLNRILLIGAVSFLLATVFWLPISLISRSRDLPIRRLGRRR